MIDQCARKMRTIGITKTVRYINRNNELYIENGVVSESGEQSMWYCGRDAAL